MFVKTLNYKWNHQFDEKKGLKMQTEKYFSQIKILFRGRCMHFVCVCFVEWDRTIKWCSLRAQDVLNWQPKKRVLDYIKWINTTVRHSLCVDSERKEQTKLKKESMAIVNRDKRRFLGNRYKKNYDKTDKLGPGKFADRPALDRENEKRLKRHLAVLRSRTCFDRKWMEHPVLAW